MVAGGWDGRVEELIVRRRTGDPRSLARVGVTGGVLDAGGAPVALANLYREGGVRANALPGPNQAAGRSGETVVYLGWAFGHFGHFVLESLARLWALRELGALPVVMYQPERGLPRAHRDLLALGGAGRGRLRVQRHAVRYAETIVPQPAYTLGEAAHPRFAEMFRAHAGRGNGRAGRRAGSLVYLSRSLLDASRRLLVGEQALEAWLLRNDVTVVRPEHVTIDEQADLLRRSSDVLTPQGSAAHLAVLGSPSTRWHILCGDAVARDYALAPAVAGAHCAFYRVTDTAGRATYGTSCHVRLVLSRAVELLRREGLVRGAFGDIAAHQRRIDRQYAELWLVRRPAPGAQEGARRRRRRDLPWSARGGTP